MNPDPGRVSSRRRWCSFLLCKKRPIGETGQRLHTAIRVVAVVPPPAGLSHNRRRTLPGNAFHERVGSSRAHSRNYHNEESTAGVRIERTFSPPITRYRTILASGIEPDSVPCSSMPSSLCPGLFPGVTPFRRAGGAHVVPETLSLHIPVVRIAHGTSREPSGLLTLYVTYNGREYCRSQLEAHSFSNKPIPTTDEDGMRFHVVYQSFNHSICGDTIGAGYLPVSGSRTPPHTWRTPLKTTPMEGKMLINQFGDSDLPRPDSQVPYRPSDRQPEPAPKQ